MNITVQISEDEYKAIAEHVISVEDWLQTAISEKSGNCVQRIVSRETQRLLDDPNVDVIPATQDALLYSFFNQPGYENRAEREGKEIV